jgi:protein involved in polysaccharide export with SLBB domain
MPLKSAIAQRVMLGVSVCFVCVFAAVAPALALIHAGDQLDVTVFDHPDLSRKVIVDASGSVSLPLAGKVDAGGLEPPQIAEKIEQALTPYFKVPIDVGVELTAQTTSLFVSGGPGGVLKYVPGETLAAAIADIPSSDSTVPDKSGGVTGLERSRIDLRRVSVERYGKLLGTYDVVDLSARGEGGPELLPGDTISLVNKERVVHVYGAVARPGDAFLSAGDSLSDALEQTGGVRDTAASAGIVLERDGTTQQVALGDPLFLAPAHDGDVLTIPTAPRVSVAGLVNKPGLVELKNNFTMLNALYEAGGPTKWANLSSIQVMHNGVSKTYNLAGLAHGDSSQNPPLGDGDLVFVPEGHKIDFNSIFTALLQILYLFPRP